MFCLLRSSLISRLYTTQQAINLIALSVIDLTVDVAICLFTIGLVGLVVNFIDLPAMYLAVGLPPADLVSQTDVDFVDLPGICLTVSLVDRTSYLSWTRSLRSNLSLIRLI